MVTGDNIITARAIAKECGILDEISHDHPSEY
jgi:magnesium-transporting ATPase (P-type)